MGWDVQDSNPDAKVMVNGGYAREGEPRTDALVIDKASGEHSHVSIDQTGNVTEHHGYK